MRSDAGWVAVYRKCIEGDIGHDVVILGVWIKLLSWANWKDGTKMVDRQQVRLKRGQLITSYQQIADSFNKTNGFKVSAKRVRTAIAYLEKTSRLGKRSGTHGTVITILNYEQYQAIEETRGKPTGKRGANGGQTVGNIRTREQGNKETSNPPTPRKRGRGFKETATLLKDEMVSHYLHERLDQPQCLSDDLRGYLEWKYREPRIAGQALKHAVKNGSLTVFEAQAVKSLEAYLKK